MKTLNFHGAMSVRPARSSRRLAITWIAAAALVAPLISLSQPAAAAGSTTDGLTSATAAGSCWEAKQSSPNASDGIYWLITPALRSPQQFYCDMTTDGGGWVLIARGREGWKGQYNGLRSPTSLRTVVEGTGAFSTAQLPAKTVDALLNNERVDALTDGIRLRRAMSQDGLQRQEVRFTMTKRDRWVWTFGAEHPVGAFRFDEVSGAGGQTNSFGLDSAYRRVDTNATQSQGFLGGMGFGSQVLGSTSATSYLWSKTDGAGSARPFTQMFLRPKLSVAEMNFVAIPDSGTPVITQRPLPDSDATSTVWGVSGLGNGVDGEFNTEVSAFGQVGDTVFVGGNFRFVQRSKLATGVDKVEQPFLAAFNVHTGEWIPSFRPQLNDQVKAMVGLPDGRLAVGGQFSRVNGVDRRSFVILDAVTGATSPGWQVDVENRTSGGTTQVRGLSIHKDQLYVSGSFTHWIGAGGTTASAWNGARINLATGQPDRSWNPALNGTSVGVEASPAGDRAYFAGYFRQSGNVPTVSGTAIQTSVGAAVVSPTWKPQFSKSGVDALGNVTGNVWQLGVAEAAGGVWLGGSEHSLFSYNRDTFARTSGNITKNGGDYQTVEAFGDTVYAGCHCGDWVYSNAYSWRDVGSSWTQADKINLIGAWDAATGNYLQEFSPVVQARRGFGAWALFRDSVGTLWAGGDFSSSVRVGGISQWSGGFIRFRARDVKAPTSPTVLTGVPAANSTVTLSWGAATDDRGSVRYEVIRGNRVVATTSARTINVPAESSPTRYFVRAIDLAGNRSASTGVFVVTRPSTSTLDLVKSGSVWKWSFSSTALAADWTLGTFDDSGWAVGSAVLGFGATAVTTDVSAGAVVPRPLSAQFRQIFVIADPGTITNPKISVIANDGVVVYLNGVEVGRANLPAGAISQSTYATAAPSTTAAAASRIIFDVPRSALVQGNNVVTASTHANFRSTPDISFDLRLTAEQGQTTTSP